VKIIKVDNFNREYISEQLIAENVSDYYAGIIAEDLNKRFSGNSSPDYFRAFNDNYKPYIFEP